MDGCHRPAFYCLDEDCWLT